MESQTRLLTGRKGMEGIAALLLSGILVGCATGVPSGGTVQPMADTKPSRESHVNFQLHGTIEEVEDGDTVTIKAAPGGGKFAIRMSDIDTPETFHAKNPYADDRNKDGSLKFPNAPRDAPGQPLGKAAWASLNALAPLKATARADCYETDIYGRMVCHIFVGTINLNLEQIKRGWAMTPSNLKWIRDPASKPAEDAAKVAKSGVWALPTSKTPDAWRDDCWKAGQCAGAEP